MTDTARVAIPSPKTPVAETTAETPFTRRARYFDSDNAFNITYPPVPPHSFIAERDTAFDPATGTALIPLDLSGEMGMPFPATTPLVLASYARIRAGESLQLKARASVALFYVIEGTGRSLQGAVTIAWRTGDVFCLPGGRPSEHVSADGDSVLWVVTNEPLLAFEHLAPPLDDAAIVEAVHFPAAEIARELKRVHAKLTGKRTTGLAVVFASAGQEAQRNISPTLTFAMNQLPPGGAQIPHSHNSVAVSLAIAGAGCYSMIDGARKDWQPYATMVTPPRSVHSHHNSGDDWGTLLIAQDGGLYYHCRTMDLRYAEDQP